MIAYRIAKFGDVSTRDVLVAVLPLVGVLVGAIIQRVPAKSKERDGQFTNLRNETEADYLRGVSAVPSTGQRKRRVLFGSRHG